MHHCGDVLVKLGSKPISILYDTAVSTAVAVLLFNVDDVWSITVIPNDFSEFQPPTASLPGFTGISLKYYEIIVHAMSDFCSGTSIHYIHFRNSVSLINNF